MSSSSDTTPLPPSVWRVSEGWTSAKHNVQFDADAYNEKLHKESARKLYVDMHVEMEFLEKHQEELDTICATEIVGGMLIMILGGKLEQSGGQQVPITWAQVITRDLTTASRMSNLHTNSTTAAGNRKYSVNAFSNFIAPKWKPAPLVSGALLQDVQHLEVVDA